MLVLVLLLLLLLFLVDLLLIEVGSVHHLVGEELLWLYLMLLLTRWRPLHQTHRYASCGLGLRAAKSWQRRIRVSCRRHH